MVTYLRNNQAVSWPGLEPATQRSQVQRPNHCTTEPLVIRDVTGTRSSWTWPTRRHFSHHGPGYCRLVMPFGTQAPEILSPDPGVKNLGKSHSLWALICSVLTLRVKHTMNHLSSYASCLCSLQHLSLFPTGPLSDVFCLLPFPNTMQTLLDVLWTFFVGTILSYHMSKVTHFPTVDTA